MERRVVDRPIENHETPSFPDASSPPFGLTWTQATQILANFQLEYTLRFPFIRISQDIRAEELYNYQPFLFRAIMLIAAPVPLQRLVKMKRNTLAYLGYRMLVEEEKSLDLLQGLSVVIAWISTKHARRNPLDTPHIDTCCKAIAEAQDRPSELILDHIVRLTQMNEKLSKGFGEPHERTISGPYAFLLEGNGRRFRTELDRLAEESAHPDLAKDRVTFDLYHQYLLVRLYEPAVVVAEHPDEGVAPFIYLSLCLRNSLDAMKSFFDLLLSSSIEATLRYSITTSDHAVFVMVMAARLLLITTPDWDAQSARQTVDLSAMLDRFLDRIDHAEALRKRSIHAFTAVETTGSLLEEEDGKSSLSDLAQKTRSLKVWFEARLQGRTIGEGPFLESTRESIGKKTEDGDSEGGTTWSGGLLGNMAWNFDSL
ncbi:hypothetical protein FZEAL_9342 [Fusarium zealandicum]|uniref:Uncharacterized protein n=1 Tax=Fusarium zealandicum TaxID=1053134 RepID=A0A8H4XGM2_9HYPO|nr:hypothetical protein FZEAL_9342 [Fusarium zealandicum]